MSRKSRVRGLPLIHGLLQDSFEDASDLAPPRPDSHSDRSRSRSLLNRESSSSTVQDARAGSPPPEIAEAPESDDDVEQPKSEKPGGEASSTKSPLLTAHRISLTSDMDDVSLDGGEFHSLGYAE